MKTRRPKRETLASAREIGDALRIITMPLLTDSQRMYVGEQLEAWMVRRFGQLPDSMIARIKALGMEE